MRGVTCVLSGSIYVCSYIYSARASNSSIVNTFKHIALIKYRLAKNKSVAYPGKHTLHISRPLLSDPIYTYSLLDS